MAGQRYDVLSARKYRTRDGQDKTAWSNVGVAFESKDGKGFSLSLHCIPVPDKESGEVRLLMRLPMPKDDAPRGGGSRGGQSHDYGGDDTDIPF